MQIAMGAGSEVLGTPMRPQDIVGDVVAAEAEGFGSAWTVHFSRGVDALSVLAVAGTRTSRIDLGVGIVPTYPRHPLALVQQAATAQAFCGGRLTLGVGVSHRPVIEGLYGLAYQQPAAHMRDYLSVLVPLLREGSLRYRGRFHQVDGGFTVPGTSPVTVLVGALSPLMVQAAGELADGIVTWLAGPRTLGEEIIPGCSGRPGTGRPQAGPRPGWWLRFRWRLRQAPGLIPGPRSRPPTRCSPGTRGSTTTEGCWSARGRVTGRPGHYRNRGRDREAAQAAGRSRCDRAVAYHLPGRRRPRPQPAGDQGAPAEPGCQFVSTSQAGPARPRWPSRWPASRPPSGPPSPRPRPGRGLARRAASGSRRGGPGGRCHER